ncbi:DUF397 domain-containing protein [Streptomyces sp. CHA1]|uniref:DUF397 domain-containing protein n=1 Tax=Streptomyces TaxID=1883 RepID=UPI00053DFD08|nr:MULTISPECIES: DUF397 domain-containing protein [unclassified Streptomyces]MBT3158651.1 DUF397 domain-containing protein [Streptomyces sp. G11C]MCO6701944.1 DUF397 domain-containing protein [Streptomyces sp. CHB9.2]MCO6708295.1 DUF397 domain-containing protein [Streptomyces sp. CHA3]MCO6714226.1 DUF397 domain-containing protein [Streptomyces sp. CHB19.2]MCO6720456.1 DUF397 domain-containing protein [Streptomyces sp. Vc714c-19]
MSENPSPNPLWVSSSYSGNGGGNCLQWQPLSGQNGQVPVRDSKDTALPGFTVAAPAWSVFVDYAKSVVV